MASSCLERFKSSQAWHRGSSTQTITPPSTSDLSRYAMQASAATVTSAKPSKRSASSARILNKPPAARHSPTSSRHHVTSAYGLTSSRLRTCSGRNRRLQPQAISSAAAAAGAAAAVAAAAAAALQHRRPSGGAHRLSVVAPSGASSVDTSSQQPPAASTTAASASSAATDAAPSDAARAANGQAAAVAGTPAGAQNGSKSGEAAAAGGRKADAEGVRKQVVVTTVGSIFEFSPEEWDACATSSGDVSPFLLHAFFAALEASGSAAPDTGWVPCHIALREGAPPGAPETSGRLRAVVPAYIKSHSYGEYVFDHSWANLHHQLGTPYYPKLQCAVPFTPAPGARMLIAPGEDEESLRRTMLAAVPQVGDALKVSSVHMTFNTEPEWRAAGQAGWQSRLGLQYHWENNGYSTFDDFLAALKQSKRKSIRQERKSIAKQGLRVRRLWGRDVTPRIWDAFYEFYINTTDRKWGSRYLTKDFFVRLGASMADRVLLVVAYDDAYDPDLPVAAALNLVGSNALVGRNWGCRFGSRYKNLHFELCYYQAIEAAIELGLDRVEAGAQGEHKISRGYLPTPTYSSHYLRNAAAGLHIRRFLRSEAAQMDDTIAYLTEAASPFKDVDSAEAQHAADALASVRGAADEQKHGTESTDSGDSSDA